MTVDLKQHYELRNNTKNLETSVLGWKHYNDPDIIAPKRHF